MTSNFCDRCGCQLTEENTADFGKIRYEVKLNNPSEADDNKYHAFQRGRYGTKYIGRYLIFCKDCQKIIDRVIENECFAYLPEKTVVDVKKMKKNEG